MSRITIMTACVVAATAASVHAQSRVSTTAQRPSAAALEAWPGKAKATTATRNVLPVANLKSRQLTDDPGFVPEPPQPMPPLPPQGAPLGPYIDDRGPPIRVRDCSRIYIEAIPPAEIKVHDIVSIVVDEKSEVIMNQRFNRQKNMKLKAELKDFIRLNNGKLDNAAGNSPTIDSQLQAAMLASGTLTDQEGIKYRIAATVKDVKPNGTITLEARKVIRNEDDASEYLLTGEIRAQDIKPDNTASSEDIANLSITKHAKGRVYDSTKRGWGVRLLDLLSPF